MNDRAGSVGVPKQSLYALQQRKCRQSLNLQELYKKLTSRRMSLLSGRCRVCGRLLRAKYDELPARVLFRNRPTKDSCFPFATSLTVYTLLTGCDVVSISVQLNTTGVDRTKYQSMCDTQNSYTT